MAAELAAYDARIKQATAGAEWGAKVIAKETAALKAAKDDKSRAAHEAALKAAQMKLKGHTDYLAGIATIRAELAAGIAAQKKKQDEAESFLSNAAEKKAA